MLSLRRLLLLLAVGIFLPAEHLAAPASSKSSRPDKKTVPSKPSLPGGKAGASENTVRGKESSSPSFEQFHPFDQPLFSRDSWPKDRYLLHETERYRGYVEYLYPHGANLLIIHKLGDNDTLANDDTFWHMLEKEILPRAKWRDQGRIVVQNHIDGWYYGIGHAGARDFPVLARSEREVLINPRLPFSSVDYRGSRAKSIWKPARNDHSIVSLAKLQERIAPQHPDNIRKRAEQELAEQQRNRAALFRSRREKASAQQDRVRRVLGTLKLQPESFKPGVASFSTLRHKDFFTQIQLGEFAQIYLADDEMDDVRKIVAWRFYSTYHAVYHDTFGSVAGWNWDVFEMKMITTTSNGYGRVLYEQETGSWKYHVRSPFRDVFAECYDRYDQGLNIRTLFTHYTPADSKVAQLTEDLRIFLEKEGAPDSPAIRHFETNLHLMLLGLAPLQDLNRGLVAP